MNKRIILLLAALCIAGSVHAKGSTESAEDQQQSQVSFEQLPRVLIFTQRSNDVTAQGEIVICPREIEVNWRKPGICERNGLNAWQLAETALPGWVLKRYEYRFTGSSGYHTLILYFGKK